MIVPYATQVLYNITLQLSRIVAEVNITELREHWQEQQHFYRKKSIAKYYNRSIAIIQNWSI